MEHIFKAGFREYAKHRKQGSASLVTLDSARRAMRATYQREIDALEAHLSGLATVGSVSPYIGLFGTVWGIMNSFRGLANVAQATLAQRRAGHRRSADRHRDRPVRGDSGGDRATTATRTTSTGSRRATRRSSRSSRTSCSGRATLMERTATVHAEAPAQIDQPDQRRAVHRRDAGAAHHLHGHRAADQPRPDRAAVGRQQAHDARAAARSHVAQRHHALAARPAGEHARGARSRATSSWRACARSRRSRSSRWSSRPTRARATRTCSSILDLLQRNGVKKVGLLARPPAT